MCVCLCVCLCMCVCVCACALVCVHVHVNICITCISNKSSITYSIHTLDAKLRFACVGPIIILMLTSD